jgi:hypothetical protein
MNKTQNLPDITQNFWQLFSIQMAGGIISIPVLSVGPLIALTSGAMNAVLSIFLGNFIILIMSLAIVLMFELIALAMQAIKSRQTTIP